MAIKQNPPSTLYDKIFNSKVVHEQADGSVLLYIDRHLIYECTSPQAFEGLRSAGRRVRCPRKTLATLDHNVPTTSRANYSGVSTFFEDEESKLQCLTLEKNVKDFGVRYFGLEDRRQGIVHVIGPEQGFTLPGTTIVCGDSHTSTHGAFGALAFGIGTSEVEHVLATQTLISRRSKNMRIQIEGVLQPSITSKDLILHIIGVVGTAGGTGAVIEYCGLVVRNMSMAARMSMCNMSVEAGARAGMVAPDDVTFAYLKDRPLAPKGADWNRAIEYWQTLASDEGCTYDIDVRVNADDIIPTISWGTSPQDVVPISGTVPDPEDFENEDRRRAARRALHYMDLKPGTRMQDISIDTAFIGSCTNSRLEDLQSAARIVDGRKIAPNIKLAMVVPGSGLVKYQAETMGLDKIFKKAGFEWREAGCSMCVAMNPDVQAPGDRCASTSNRNFEDRQGARVRTHLMSPAMVAAAAITGKLVDVRELAKSVRIDSHAKMSITPEMVEVEDDLITERRLDTTVDESSQPTSTHPAISARPPFLKIKGIAAHMDKSNIDTDYILPKQFCKTIQKRGLGRALFYYARTNADDNGSENPDFILNQEPYKHARILVCTGPNFGCGSSREHAAWALVDFGISCVIAPSFADIFFNNCFKNGILPIEMNDANLLNCLSAEAKAGREIEIDLVEQQIHNATGGIMGAFSVDKGRKKGLMNGEDEIAGSLRFERDITAYEERMKWVTPWLYRDVWTGAAAATSASTSASAFSIQYAKGIPQSNEPLKTVKVGDLQW